VQYATDGTFTYAIRDDLGAFDPYHSQLIFGYEKLAYDSLVNVKSDGKFVSGLAEKWAADARSATFTLRRDVTCSDGAPLTAGQVAADLTYLGNPKNQSPQYGAKIPTVPFTVTGDDGTRTVTVTMKRPFGFLLNTIGQAPIVCAKGLKDPKLLKTASDGTGPFVLTKVVTGQSYTFTVREDYSWGPSGARTKVPGMPAKVVLKVVTNETTAANLLLAGEVNFAQITGADRRRLTAQRLDKVELRLPAAWLWFNQQNDRPTADRRVRQALISALDIDQVVKVSTDGQGSVSKGLVAVDPKPCTADTISGQLPAHDAAAAEALLDQAGWRKRADGIRQKDDKPLTVDLHYIPAATTPPQRPTAELLSQRWKAIGAQVKTTADTYVKLNETMFQSGNWDIYISAFGPNLPSGMMNYLSGPVPPKGTNFAGIDNKDYNTLVAKAQTMTPPGACTYWDRAEQALYRDVDPVPISDSVKTIFLQKAQADATIGTNPIPTSLRVLK
jgi:peptide/nickel transport system substrate-binding protein